MSVGDGVGDDVAFGSVSDILFIPFGNVDFVDFVNYCVAAGVLIKIFPGVSPVVVFAEFDRGADVHAVSGELNGDAVGSEVVLVVGVIPDFEHHDFDLFYRVSIGQSGDLAFDRSVAEFVPFGQIDFGPAVNDEFVFFVVLGQIAERCAPADDFGEFGGFAARLTVGKKLNGEYVGSEVVLVVGVIPDLDHGGFGQFGIDHVVADDGGGIACDLVFGDGVFDRDVFAADDLIHGQVRERPAPVGIFGRDVILAGVFAVRQQADGDAFGSVFAVAVEPGLFTFDIGDERVVDHESVRHAAGNDAYVAADRVFGHGVFDFFGSAAGTVFGEVFEHVAPVAGLEVSVNAYGFLEHFVRIEVEHYAARTGVAGVVVILPEFLDRDIDVFADIGVSDVVADIFGLVAGNDVFFDRIVDHVAAVIVLVKAGEAPAPVSVLIGINGERIDLSGTRHKVDIDMIGTNDLGDIIVADPLFVAFDIDGGGSVGEGDGRVFAVFDVFFSGAERNVRQVVIAGSGSDGLVRFYGVGRDEAAAFFRNDVARIFGQAGEGGDLAVSERELYVPAAVAERGEGVFGAAYGISIGSTGGEIVERHVEVEFGRVARLSAVEHLGHFESAGGRSELGVGHDSGNRRFGGLAGLTGVGDAEAFNVSFFYFVPEFKRRAGLIDRGKSGDVCGLVVHKHHRAYAVGEVNVAVKSVDLCRDSLERAVGVKRNGDRELAGEIIVGEFGGIVVSDDLGDVESDRDRYVFVVFYSHVDLGAGFGKRAGRVGDGDFVFVFIFEHLGDRVDDARGKVGDRSDAVVLERDIGSAVQKRNVAVKLVGNGVAFEIGHFYMYGELGLFVFDAGHYLIDYDAHVIGNDFGVGDLYAVFALFVFYESVGGDGRDGAARGVVDLYGVIDSAVGFITRQRAFPEIIRAVDVVNVEGVAPGVAVDMDPFVGFAGVAYILLRSVFGLLAVIESDSAAGNVCAHIRGCGNGADERRNRRGSLISKVAGESRVGRERAVVLVVFRMR